MLKKVGLFVFCGFLSLTLCGCFLLLAGAAGGGGTAVWLSGKLTQEFNAPYDRTVRAAESSLRSMGLEIRKESREDHVTQLKSEYKDGKDIWIDVRRITDDSTKVEVRVGGVSPDKEAASKILKRIESYL